MSDTLEPDALEAPEAPANEQEVAEATETPEDLGALKRALEHEREERRQAKEELRRIREDETARDELLKEWGYEVAEDEDSDEDDLQFEDDDPIAPLNKELSELKQWREQQEAEKTAAQIRTDLDAIHGDSDWDLDDKARRWIVNEAAQDPKGFDRGALERAHKDLIDQWEAIAARGVERARDKPKRKAPHVTAAGKAVTDQVHDWSSMTPEQQAEVMAAKIRANQAQ